MSWRQIGQVLADMQTGANMSTLCVDSKINIIKAWLRRRSMTRNKPPVTADELTARVRRNWPNTNDEDMERIYQACGHL